MHVVKIMNHRFRQSLTRSSIRLPRIGLIMDASTPPSASKWGSVSDYKKRKSEATPDGKRVIFKPDDRPRDLTLGQYQNNTKQGCWLRANVKGSKFKVDRHHPLLSLPEHDLVIGRNGYFDFGWNSHYDVNMGKMISMGMAEKAARAVVSRFSDLKFRVDLSNGKFYTDTAMVFWNNSKEELAVVGMGVMRDRFLRIFPDADFIDKKTVSTGQTTSQVSSFRTSQTTELKGPQPRSSSSQPTLASLSTSS